MRRGRSTAILIFLAAAFGAVAASPPDILVSRQLLLAQGLRVGEEVLFSRDPQGKDPRPFRVAGTYEPTPDPMRLTQRRWEARMHLPDLLDLEGDPRDPLALESVEAIHVRLGGDRDVGAFSRLLEARAPGLFVQASSGAEVDNPFRILERFHRAIAAVTVVGSTAFLLALMVMRVEERREIAGTLRLVGFSRGRILLVVLAESLAVAAVGAFGGIGLAAATEGLVNAFFRHRYDTPLVFVRITPSIAVRSLAIAIPAGVAAGLVASWRLLRLEIRELLRR